MEKNGPSSSVLSTVSTTRRLVLMDHHRSQISNFLCQNLRIDVARTAINLSE